jgi:hypothetical protein
VNDQGLGSDLPVIQNRAKRMSWEVLDFSDSAADAVHASSQLPPRAR